LTTLRCRGRRLTCGQGGRRAAAPPNHRLRRRRLCHRRPPRRLWALRVVVACVVGRHTGWKEGAASLLMARRRRSRRDARQVALPRRMPTPSPDIRRRHSRCRGARRRCRRGPCCTCRHSCPPHLVPVAAAAASTLVVVRPRLARRPLSRHGGRRHVYPGTSHSLRGGGSPWGRPRSRVAPRTSSGHTTQGEGPSNHERGTENRGGGSSSAWPLRAHGDGTRET
jgi:hypothetical protein